MPQWNANADQDSDEFARDSFGKTLTLIMRAMGGSSAVVLDGPWGAGKTHFVNLWRREGQLRTVYFNAFEADYYEDPFIPLCATLIEEFPERNNATRKFISKAKGVLGAFLKVGLRTGIRAISCNSINPNDILNEPFADLAADLQDDVATTAADMLSKMVDEGLQEFTDGKLCFSEFKDALKDLLALTDKEKQPLVFIVDELDRCRPEFAVEVVEKIKHLFSVPGVVFLLVINQEQLSSAFMSQYGCTEEAAARYMRKFVDLRVELPRNALRSRNTVGDFFQNQLSAAWENIPELKGKHISAQFVERVRLMVDQGGATARDAQQIVTSIAMMHVKDFGFGQREPYSTILAPLIVLSVVSPFMLKTLQQSPAEFFTIGGVRYEKLMKALGLSRTLVGPDEDHRAHISKQLEKFIHAIHQGQPISDASHGSVATEEIFRLVNSMPFHGA